MLQNVHAGPALQDHMMWFDYLLKMYSEWVTLSRSKGPLNIFNLSPLLFKT